MMEEKKKKDVVYLDTTYEDAAAVEQFVKTHRLACSNTALLFIAAHND